MIYDAINHRPHTRLWAPSEGKNGSSGVLGWVWCLRGGGGLVVFAGSLYLVAHFYRFV